MSFELKAALEGNLYEALKEEVAAGERAAMRAMRNVSDRAKQRLRDQITGAGMGQRLANTWRNNLYPSHGTSLDAAALIWTKAPLIIRAFVDGVTINAVKGRYLAIPTDAVPKQVTIAAAGDQYRRKRVTPERLQQAMGVKLRFVPAGHGRRFAMLVLDDAKLTKGGRARQASKTAIAKGHVATVVMFILVPQVRLPKRFDVERVEAMAENELETEVVAQWKAETG